MPQVNITAEMVKQDGQNRVARTGVQSGVSGALIIVGLWVARQFGWHGHMDPEVVASLGVLLTTAGSVVSNRSRPTAN